MRTPGLEWVPISWVEALKIAAAQWYSWGLLSFGIYWVNRRLPFGKDALLRRLLCHVPLSLVFTVAYTYLNYGATLLLGVPAESPWLGPSVLETARPRQLPARHVRLLGHRRDLHGAGLPERPEGS